jgi:hypothetical protein
LSNREKDLLRAIELLRMAQAMIADAWVGYQWVGYVPHTEKQKLGKHVLKESERLVGEGIAKAVEAHDIHKSIVEEDGAG